MPEPWTPTIDDLMRAGVRGVVYAHELVRVAPGTVRALLDEVVTTARPAIEALGVLPVGAFRVAMRNDDEALLLWAFPDFDAWVRYERAWDTGPLADWRATLVRSGAVVERMLLADAPLAPLRLGRQPEVGDRRPLSEIR